MQHFNDIQNELTSFLSSCVVTSSKKLPFCSKDMFEGLSGFIKVYSKMIQKTKTRLRKKTDKTQYYYVTNDNLMEHFFVHPVMAGQLTYQNFFGCCCGS